MFRLFSSSRVRFSCLAGAAVLLLAAGCSSSPAGSAKDPSSAGNGASSNGAEEPATDLKEPEGPPPLTAAERKELAATCNPIEEQLYNAGKQAKLTVENLWFQDPKAKGLDQKGLEEGLKLLADPGGLSAGDHQRCKDLFSKKTKHELFLFEPAEKAAKETLDACARAAASTFGTRKMAFDMSAAPAGYDPNVPRFCSDADPVPESLADLPYKSKADDWRTDEWQCLEFGLRVEQHFQLEYRTDPTATKGYECIARYLPRKGGPAVELIRWGEFTPEGELKHAKKPKRKLIPRP